jgi:hypothetical protein
LATLIRKENGDAATILEAATEYAELALPASEKREILLASLRQRHDQLKYGLGSTLPMEPKEREQIAVSLAELAGKSTF